MQFSVNQVEGTGYEGFCSREPETEQYSEISESYYDNPVLHFKFANTNTIMIESLL